MAIAIAQLELDIDMGCVVGCGLCDEGKFEALSHFGEVTSNASPALRGRVFLAHAKRASIKQRILMPWN